MTKGTAFGRYLRSRRVEASISQRKLAEILGVSHVYLGEVERGIRGPLARERWAVLARAVKGITLTDLEKQAAMSRPMQLDLSDAPPRYLDLAGALARRLQSRNLSNAEVDKLMRMLKRENDD